jgi:hypothetical protein
MNPSSLRIGALPMLFLGLMIAASTPSLVNASPKDAAGIAAGGGSEEFRGTVFSKLGDEYVIQSGRELVHIRKDGLSNEQRSRIDGAGAHEIALAVPASAITRIRPPRAR